MSDTSNPYAPPNLELMDKPSELNPVQPFEMYTPFQVRLASFLGGPIAAVYTLHQNFNQLGDARAKELTVGLGVAFNLILFAILPFLPDRFPNQLLPLLYSIGAGAIASSKQLTKEKIKESSQYTRRSTANMTMVIILSLVIFLALLSPFVMVLDHFGLI